MKVEYVLLNGRTSTAYLDDEPEVGAWDIWHGEDKYTDNPVRIVNDDGVWRQIA